LQQPQLLVAADEWCAGRAQRLEAALGAALAQYPCCDNRCGEALDVDRPEILVVNMANFLRTLALPEEMALWSLTTIRRRSW
jgi:hypothetical protein